MLEISVTAPLFHDECKIFDFSKKVALYLAPWANSPSIHWHATLLSPHSLHCRSSFARVHNGVSRTQIYGCLFLNPLFFCFVFLCSVESFILFKM